MVERPSRLGRPCRLQASARTPDPPRASRRGAGSLGSQGHGSWTRCPTGVPGARVEPRAAGDVGAALAMAKASWKIEYGEA
eukprot:4700866-Pyramimonas_sp.AAC.1